MVGQVDTVQAALVNPLLQLIGNSLGGTHQNRTHAAGGAVLGDVLAGPLLLLILQGEGGEEGLNRLGLNVLEGLVLIELIQVKAAPAADDALG